jgi:hypothetical protein
MVCAVISPSMPVSFWCASSLMRRVFMLSPNHGLYSKANKAFLYTKYTQCKRCTGMKHNISITMDQKLFREIENTRGREKRSTFIEHLVARGLKAYKKEETAAKSRTSTTAGLSMGILNETHE